MTESRLNRPLEDSGDSYERGFADGLRWVANILRHSAFMVEQTKYGDFHQANGGPPVRAITQTGQIHFAKQLREVAKIIEEAIGEPAQ